MPNVTYVNIPYVDLAGILFALADRKYILYYTFIDKLILSIQVSN